MDFRLLGPVEVWIGETRVDFGRSVHRKLVAALALQVGQVVGRDGLIDVVWDAGPPPTYRQQLQKGIHALRRVLGEDTIRTTGGGYRLDVGRDQVDAHRFADQVGRARALPAAQAAPALRRALAMWRGSALTGVASEALRPAAMALDEQRLTVLEECVGVELELGDHARVVPELSALVAEHPVRERLVEHLMVALYRCGRQSEALEAYDQLRRRLADEQAVAPSISLQRLHQSLLRQDEALDPPATDGWQPPVASCLPADPRIFTGRTAELAALDSLLLGRAGTVVMAAVVGMAGVGKTALAVHWAHRVRHEFPDGQLYVNLRGYDRSPPMTATEALGVFLAVLGVPPTHVPADLDGMAALYRSTLADRRVLVVLDNAASADQVATLVPGTAGCRVVVTSRDALTELVTLHDAHRVRLDVLAEDEAEDLVRLVGPAAPHLDDHVVAEVARLCGFLPLALRLAAANLAGCPQREVADALETLGRDRLSGLPAVRSAFGISYRTLTDGAARLLRALAHAPGVDVSTGSAGVLAGAPARELLRELEAAHLVEHYLPGRYRLHDLVREHAADHGDDAERDTVVTALLQHQLAEVDAATDAMGLAVLPLSRPRTVAPFPDRAAALDHLRAERLNVVAGVLWAHDRGVDALCAHLVDALRGFLWHDRHTTELQALGEIGLVSAQRIGDDLLAAAMHRAQGLAHHVLGRAADANSHNLRAADLLDRAGHYDLLAGQLCNLGMTLSHAGELTEALAHLERAVRICAQHGIAKYHVHALQSISYTYAALGRLTEALEHAELGLAHSAGTHSQAHGHYLVGTVNGEAGRLEPALRHSSFAAEHWRDAGYRIGELHAVLAHCRAATCAGDDSANHLLTAASDAVADVEDGRLGIDLLDTLAGAACARGDLAEHHELCERIVRSGQDVSSARHVATALLGLVHTSCALGDPIEARRYLEQADALIGERQLRLVAGRAHRARAVVDLTRADAERALAVHRETGQLLEQVADLVLLAELARRDGDAAAAENHAGEAASVCADAAGGHAASALGVITAVLRRTIGPADQPG